MLSTERLQRAMELAGRTGEVRLEHLGHAHAAVHRVHFGDDSTVVVKTPRPVDTVHPFGSATAFDREIAGLVVAQGSDVAPEMIGYDREVGVLVIEDVGDTVLDDIIRGDDRESAFAAMVKYGAAMGRLHRATAGRQDEYDDVERAPAGTWRGVDGWPDIESECAALGLPSPGEASDEIGWLTAAIADPGWQALAHGDLSPWNTHFRSVGSVVFVDFEGATFGHVGLDLSWIHFPFTNCSDRWSILPRDVVRESEAAYRSAAAPVDDARFSEMRAVGAAAALLVRLQRLERIAQSSDESWRRRTQMVHQLDVFVALAEAGDCLSGLAQWCAALSAAMRSRWSDCGDPPPPLFAAFA